MSLREARFSSCHASLLAHLNYKPQNPVAKISCIFALFPSGVQEWKLNAHQHSELSPQILNADWVTVPHLHQEGFWKRLSINSLVCSIIFPSLKITLQFGGQMGMDGCTLSVMWWIKLYTDHHFTKIWYDNLQRTPVYKTQDGLC